MVDKSYVAESFDFEKIIIPFILSRRYNIFPESELIEIRMNNLSDEGDIDLRLTFRPSERYEVQIKSNKSNSNFTKGKAFDGFMQLFLAYLNSGRDSATYYVLMFEGTSTESYIRTRSKTNNSYSNGKDWEDLIMYKLQKNPEVLNQVKSLIGDDTPIDAMKPFIDNFFSTRLMYREDILYYLNEHFDMTTINEFWGALVETKCISERKDLKKVEFQNNLELPSDIYETKEFHQFKEENFQSLSNEKLLQKFKNILPEVKARKYTDRNIKNYIYGEYLIRRIGQKRPNLYRIYEKIKDAQLMRINTLPSHSSMNLKDFTAVYNEYITQLRSRLGGKISQSHLECICGSNLSKWLYDCPLDFVEV